MNEGPWALRDINLEVRRGETLGIIGRNGAGKSTLLKVLAGVTPPTRGSVDVRGRIFPMIELNAGLHQELTGRENVYLLGAVMGLTRAQVAKKMPEIEAFCELKEWFDRPVRKYSSGMLARLGFSVAMNVDANILLIDEVLAVGDLSFQRKCFRLLEQLRSGNGTFIFVSHNLRQIERLCDRVLLLDRGCPRLIDDASYVVNEYYNRSQRSVSQQDVGSVLRIDNSGTGEVTVTKIEFLDQQGHPTEKVTMFDSLLIRVHFQAEERIDNPIFVIGILSPEMYQITNFNTAELSEYVTIEGSGHFLCEVPSVHLLPGTYGIRCVIMSHLGQKLYRADDIARFQVISKNYDMLRTNAGFVYTPVKWEFNCE